MGYEICYKGGFKLLTVSRSPIRISYAGGGSDYQTFFQRHKGCVVSATINKFVYFLSLPQWPLAEDNYRFTYRRTESVTDYKLFQHPVINRLLTNLDWDSPLNMATMADVPGESGLGSSSAFTAAAIQNLNFRLGKLITGSDLAREAIALEREQLLEPGGWQDQVATACGGFRVYEFSENNFETCEVILPNDTKNYLASRQILVATDFKRKDDSVARVIQDSAGGQFFNSFKEGAEIARHLGNSLRSEEKPSTIYSLIVDAVLSQWALKRQIPMDVQFQIKLGEVLERLDHINVDAFKLLGSGNGGYVLVFANPEKIDAVESWFGKERCIRFNYSMSGTSTRRSLF